MEGKLEEFFSYLHNTKKTSENTEQSYRRDLVKLNHFLQDRGLSDYLDATEDVLREYVQYLKEHQFAPTTISRNIAAIKNLYHYMYQRGWMQEEVAERLKPPKIEKKIPEIMTTEEIENLLKQPSGNTPKEIRDKAMLELLYATGMRVSELIGLTLDSIDLPVGTVECGEGGRTRKIPFGDRAKKSIMEYLLYGREGLLVEDNCDALFVNCSGQEMSRQGFWKILKSYAKKAGINSEITPHTLRHSFAAHMVENGTDLKSIQEIMGHSDISTTQIYITIQNAHPEKIHVDKNVELAVD